MINIMINKKKSVVFINEVTKLELVDFLKWLCLCGEGLWLFWDIFITGEVFLYQFRRKFRASIVAFG